MNEVSFEEMQKIVQDKSTMIVDVRTNEEVAEGKIPGAVHMPLDTIEKRKNELKGSVIFYCKAGGRAKRAAELVIAQGSLDVAVYKGSMTEWVEKNGEIEY